MKIVDMRTFEGSTRTKAFFDLVTEEGITIKGFKIVDGSNGLFVSFPREQGKDGNWYDKVKMPRELSDKLNEMALNEYGGIGSSLDVEDSSDEVPF